MAVWNQGRPEIDRMLTARELQRVPPSRPHADALLAQARRHLESARRTAADDPEGAYALLYDAARKALTAVLENQGLRPTTSGGHLAVYHATRAQLDPPLGRQVRHFDRMRRQRRDAEYPGSATPSLTSDDVAEDLEHAVVLVEIAEGLLDQMSPF